MFNLPSLPNSSSFSSLCYCPTSSSLFWLVEESIVSKSLTNRVGPKNVNWPWHEIEHVGQLINLNLNIFNKKNQITSQTRGSIDWFKSLAYKIFIPCNRLIILKVREQSVSSYTITQLSSWEQNYTSAIKGNIDQVNWSNELRTSKPSHFPSNIFFKTIQVRIA